MVDYRFSSLHYFASPQVGLTAMSSPRCWRGTYVYTVQIQCIKKNASPEHFPGVPVTDQKVTSFVICCQPWFDLLEDRPQDCYSL